MASGGGSLPAKSAVREKEATHPALEESEVAIAVAGFYEGMTQ